MATRFDGHFDDLHMLHLDHRDALDAGAKNGALEEKSARIAAAIDQIEHVSPIERMLMAPLKMGRDWAQNGLDRASQDPRVAAKAAIHLEEGLRGVEGAANTLFEWAHAKRRYWIRSEFALSLYAPRQNMIQQVETLRGTLSSVAQDTEMAMAEVFRTHAFRLSLGAQAPTAPEPFDYRENYLFTLPRALPAASRGQVKTIRRLFIFTAVALREGAKTQRRLLQRAKMDRAGQTYQPELVKGALAGMTSLVASGMLTCAALAHLLDSDPSREAPRDAA